MTILLQCAGCDIMTIATLQICDAALGYTGNPSRRSLQKAVQGNDDLGGSCLQQVRHEA